MNPPNFHFHANNLIPLSTRLKTGSSIARPIHSSQIDWNQIFAKMKAFSPLHLQPPCAPPAGIPLSFGVVEEKPRGPPSWKDIKNFLPTSCIAFSLLERLPFHFSCS